MKKIKLLSEKSITTEETREDLYELRVKINEIIRIINKGIRGGIHCDN